MSLTLQIGQNLRTIRHNAGLSQKRLGHMLGVTPQQIQKYERGVNRISADMLFILHHTLQVPYEDFFLRIPYLATVREISSKK